MGTWLVASQGWLCFPVGTQPAPYHSPAGSALVPDYFVAAAALEAVNSPSFVEVTISQVESLNCSRSRIEFYNFQALHIWKNEGWQAIM